MCLFSSYANQTMTSKTASQDILSGVMLLHATTRLLDTSGNHVNQLSRLLDSSGNHVNQLSRLLDSSGNHVNQL